MSSSSTDPAPTYLHTLSLHDALPISAWICKCRQCGFLDGTLSGRHENKLVICKFFDRQYGRDLFLGLEGEHINDWTSTRVARSLGNLPDLEPVHAPMI